MVSRRKQSHRLTRAIAHSRALAPVMEQPTTAADTTVADASTALSAKLANVIDNLRRPFKAFVSDFQTLTTSRAELAPAFMQAYDLYEAETEGTFIQFCRLVDPAIPADREHYRHDASYQAATYLRRLVQQSAIKPKRRGPKPATPLVALARFVATVLPLVDPNGAIWTAFVQEMHWSERQAKQVKLLGAKQGPVPMPRKVVEQLRPRMVG